MKTSIYLILFIAIITVSCKRDQNVGMAANPTAVMTAQKNNVLWNPYMETIISNDTMTINAKSISYNATVTPSIATVLDTMSIQVPYKGVGAYQLRSSQVIYRVYNNDGTVSNYKLDTTFNNVLNITAYKDLHNPATLNPDEFEITGTFNLKFLDPKKMCRALNFQTAAFTTSAITLISKPGRITGLRSH
jgi:hypothetical protein